MIPINIITFTLPVPVSRFSTDQILTERGSR